MARHPRLLKLAHKLHIGCVQALGHVVAFLGCVAEHAESGELSEIDDDTIEEWAQWRENRGELTAALVDVGIIQAIENGKIRSVHGWKERHTYWVRERERKHRKAVTTGAEGARKGRGRGAEGARKGRGRGAHTVQYSTVPDDGSRTRCSSSTPLPPVTPGAVSGSIEPFGSSGDEPRDEQRPSPTPEQRGLEALHQPKNLARWQAAIRAHLGEDATELAGPVEAEITATALRNGRKPAAYVEGLLKQPRRVREIAVRCREAALERSKRARAEACAERSGGAAPIASLLSQELARLGGPPPPDTS